MENQRTTNKFKILKNTKISLIVSALLTTTSLFSAPSGGVVTSGTANISQSGNTTNINQSTQKASINWQKFNISKNETVNFNQPNSSSITLNRVIGNESSVINGALNANGQVWILNSNGVLFGKNARVNTAGILATTKNLSDIDFQKGNYNFKGNSTNSVINQGTINIKDAGSVIFAANEVQNSGSIKAVKGSIHLVGADEYSINLNGNSLVNLKVDKGVLDSLVKNSGNIKADGGSIYLTTNAVDELLKGVVNNTGVIEANSIDDLKGHIELFAHGGEAQVGGTISATDGFVETSGEKVKIDNNFRVQANKWLIDPVDFTIASSGGDITGDTLSSNLNSADVEIQSADGSSGNNGNIYVNDTVTWNTDKKLTLNAYNDIFINSTINAKSGGKLALYYGQGAKDTDSNLSNYHINAPVNLSAGDNFFTKKGSDGNETTWKVITSLGSAGSNNDGTLQGMQGNLSGHYVLGANIDAKDTKTWNSGAGWNPIGHNSSNNFTGIFDGLGHTISNLYINRNSENYVGLFGYIGDTFAAYIKNIGLIDANISGGGYIGGLVGYSKNSLIEYSYITGKVSGSYYVGGLIGYMYRTTVTNSYAKGEVSGSYYVGGLIGIIEYRTTITNSYATGKVSGYSAVGGLVSNSIVDSKTNNSFYDATVNNSGIDFSSYGKTTEELQSSSTFSGWDIESFQEGFYPTLAWQYPNSKTTTIWVMRVPPQIPTTNKTNTNKLSNVKKIITTIDNKTNTNHNLPKRVTFKNSNLTTTTANKNKTVVASAIETNTNKKLVSLSEIQEQTGSSEVRVRLDDNSIITLVNNAINLPSGIEQEFYINENK